MAAPIPPRCVGPHVDGVADLIHYDGIIPDMVVASEDKLGSAIMLIRRLHRYTMPPSTSPTSRDAGDLNRRKRRQGHLVFGAAEVGSACEITTRIRTPATGAGEPINYVYLYIHIQQVFFDVLDVFFYKKLYL